MPTPTVRGAFMAALTVTTACAAPSSDTEGNGAAPAYACEQATHLRKPPVLMQGGLPPVTPAREERGRLKTWLGSPCSLDPRDRAEEPPPPFGKLRDIHSRGRPHPKEGE